LQQAATKEREAQQMLRMAQKMDALTVQIKGNVSNVDMVSQLNRISPLLQQEAQNIPIEKLYQNI
jgi:charged multivesicular body protein 1